LKPPINTQPGPVATNAVHQVGERRRSAPGIRFAPSTEWGLQQESGGKGISIAPKEGALLLFRTIGVPQRFAIESTTSHGSYFYACQGKLAQHDAAARAHVPAVTVGAGLLRRATATSMDLP